MKIDYSIHKVNFLLLTMVMKYKKIDYNFFNRL
jgi:hypothetical protein